MSKSADSSPQSLQRFLRLAEVFAMPLTALIDADAYAARSFVDFIRRYGFEPGAGEYEFGELRMVSFTYSQPNQEGAPIRRRVEVPLLSLIPLPALNISYADFAFDLQVYGAVKDETEQSLLGDEPQPASKGDPSKHPLAVRIARSDSARVATAEDGTNTVAEASTAANMKVKVRMDQSDLPEGISQMLAMMSRSTSDEPSQLPTISVVADGDPVLVDTKQRLTLIMTVRDSDGIPVTTPQRINLSQDTDEVFVLPNRASRTNAAGVATATIRLAEPPVPGTALKSIMASAVVETSSLKVASDFDSVDAFGRIQIEVQGPPNP